MRPARSLVHRILWWWPRQLDTWREFLLNSVIGSRLVSRSTRPGLLRLAGMDIGKRVTVASGVVFHGGKSLTLDEGAYINADCYLDLCGPIRFGPNSGVSFGSTLITSSHHMGPSAQRAGERYDAGIDIGEGVWVGARVTVLPGVTIGRGCVIASGAVVTKDCAPDGIYAGIPARRIRDLEPDEQVTAPAVVAGAVVAGTPVAG